MNVDDVISHIEAKNNSTPMLSTPTTEELVSPILLQKELEEPQQVIMDTQSSPILDQTDESFTLTQMEIAEPHLSQVDELSNPIELVMTEPQELSQTLDNSSQLNDTPVQTESIAEEAPSKITSTDDSLVPPVHLEDKELPEQLNESSPHEQIIIDSSHSDKAIETETIPQTLAVIVQTAPESSTHLDKGKGKVEIFAITPPSSPKGQKQDFFKEHLSFFDKGLPSPTSTAEDDWYQTLSQIENSVYAMSKTVTSLKENQQTTDNIISFLRQSMNAEFGKLQEKLALLDKFLADSNQSTSSFSHLQNSHQSLETKVDNLNSFVQIFHNSVQSNFQGISRELNSLASLSQNILRA
ncbi:uncharacterized protein [Henckelia pumila]|uniref:uncharacterized protein n=1 Tax=Henckelia pumila TaxID=405737 RepID=UPI003C6DE09E